MTACNLLSQRYAPGPCGSQRGPCTKGRLGSISTAAGRDSPKTLSDLTLTRDPLGSLGIRRDPAGSVDQGKPWIQQHSSRIWQSSRTILLIHNGSSGSHGIRWDPLGPYTKGCLGSIEAAASRDDTMRFFGPHSLRILRARQQQAVAIQKDNGAHIHNGSGRIPQDPLGSCGTRTPVDPE